MITNIVNTCTWLWCSVRHLKTILRYLWTKVFASIIEAVDDINFLNWLKLLVNKGLVSSYHNILMKKVTIFVLVGNNELLVFGVWCLIMSKVIQMSISVWYNHYLQHSRHSCLNKTFKAIMHCTIMQEDICIHVKRYSVCQCDKQ